MASNPGFYTSLREQSGYMRIGDGSKIRIEGVDDMRLGCSSGPDSIVGTACMNRI